MKTTSVAPMAESVQYCNLDKHRESPGFIVGSLIESQRQSVEFTYAMFLRVHSLPQKWSNVFSVQPKSATSAWPRLPALYLHHHRKFELEINTETKANYFLCRKRIMTFKLNKWVFVAFIISNKKGKAYLYVSNGNPGWLWKQVYYVKGKLRKEADTDIYVSERHTYKAMDGEIRDFAFFPQRLSRSQILDYRNSVLKHAAEVYTLIGRQPLSASSGSVVGSHIPEHHRSSVEFTYMMFLKVHSLPQKWSNVFSVQPTTVTSSWPGLPAFYLHETRKFQIELNTKTKANNFLCATQFELNQWVFVAITVSDSEHKLRFYVGKPTHLSLSDHVYDLDGSVREEADTAVYVSERFTYKSMDGQIRDFVFFPSKLSREEVTKHWKKLSSQAP